jgi:hypothetical protein
VIDSARRDLLAAFITSEPDWLRLAHDLVVGIEDTVSLDQGVSVGEASPKVLAGPYLPAVSKPACGLPRSLLSYLSSSLTTVSYSIFWLWL